MLRQQLPEGLATQTKNPVTLSANTIITFIEKRPLLSLYFGGLSATLLYLAALMAIPGGAEIFHAPYGYFGGQYWVNTDAINYVRPAKYFLSNGSFLDHLGGTLTPSHWGVCTPTGLANSPELFAPRITPTYHRVIGYPLIIAAFMKIFGPFWDMALLSFKVFAFALIYPSLFLIAKLVYPGKWRTSFVIWPFLFLIASGTYFIQVPFYLADMMVSLFFLLGLYFGLKSLVSLRWTDLIAHVVLLGVAALVKSILAYFVLIDVLILASFAHYRGTSKEPRSRQFIVVSFLVVLAASQFSSLRNYVNYQRYMPEDVLATNLFCELGREVAELSGNRHLYVDGLQELYKLDSTDVKLIDEEKINKAKQIILAHPLITGRVLVHHALTVLYRSHFHLFGRTLVDRPHSTIAWIMLFPLSYLSYTLLYLAFALFCVRLALQKQFLILVPLLALVGYMFLPTFLAAAGARMRLPMEGLLVVFAFAEVYLRTDNSTA